MALLFTNNGQSALASGVSSSATSMVVTTGHGARFPAPSGSDTFRATLVRASDGAIEVVDVTARSTDTMTVVRGQEGTTGLTLLAGDKFELRITAGYLNAVVAPATHAATSKTTPVDADSMPLVDSAASNVLKKVTWANIKATLKTYFDTLYIFSGGSLSGCTLDGTNAVGFLGIPQVSQSADYTLVLADAGKHILHPSADTTARTFTIPANVSVAFPIGTAITFVNQNAGGAITVAITTDTMRLAGAGTTGSRTLAANGVATAVKLTANEWIISGVNLT